MDRLRDAFLGQDLHQMRTRLPMRRNTKPAPTTSNVN
jgi:hypothetical protein